MKKIIVILASFLLAACASTPQTNHAQSSQSSETKNIAPVVTKNSTPVITNSGAATASASAIKADVESKKLAAEKLAAELRELQEKSIYFDFDKYAIKQEYQEVMRRQAEFIKAHKNDFVTIEGNADERGSAEYNLALGDNRANTAGKNLELLGVPATQIKPVSLGEEKPRLLCHEEKCWQENRRDDFVHKLN